MNVKSNKIKFLLISLLLIFAFIKSYSLHFNYRFPYHHDEWQHIALAKQAIESGYNKQYNPYLGKPMSHADLEPGFHLFLSIVVLITDLNPILNYQYLAAIFSVISALTIFYCTYKLSRKFLIGIVSMIAFISITTNVNILGTDFFVPLTMTIPFVFLFILFFVQSLKKEDSKKLFFSFAILSLIFLIHPPTFMILLFPVSIELLINFRMLMNTAKKLFIPIAFLVILIIPLIWKGSLIATKSYLVDLIYFERGWGKLEVTYFFPLLYGLINTLFGLLGFFKGYKSNFRFFTSWAFFSLAITAFFNVFGFTYFVPYPRALHYAMISMVPLTALGVKELLSFMDKKMDIKHIFVDITVILLFTFIVFNSSYDLDTEYKRYAHRVIEEPDYNTLLWIKDSIPQNKTIATPFFMTSAIYPITGHKTMSLIPAQLESNNTEQNLNFYAYDCDIQKKILEDYNVSYVLSRLELDCDFLEKIYDMENKIFKVNH